MGEIKETVTISKELFDALIGLYNLWWCEIGTVDLGDEFSDPGYVGLSIEDDQKLEEVCVKIYSILYPDYDT